MTEPTEPTGDVENVEIPENGEKPPRRGRPRPAATVERDNKVFEVLGTNALTRDEIANLVGVSSDSAYLSLHRLRREGRVQREAGGAGARWSRVDAATQNAEGENGEDVEAPPAA